MSSSEVDVEQNALKFPSISSIACNKDRLNVLYSPFRPKHQNPEHYNEKIRFWSKAIDEYCKEENTISFSGRDLQAAFTIDNKNPVCISDVLLYLQK